MSTVSVTLQFIAGPRHVAQLPASCQVEQIFKTAEEAFGAITKGGIKVVLRGSALPGDKPGQLVTLQDGDHLLVAPQRKGPSAEVMAAVNKAAAARGGSHAAGDDDDDRIELPANAARWEAVAVEWLRSRVPDWVLEWVVLVRPRRFAILVVFLAGCIAASRVGLGPVFILVSLIASIFLNLGQRRAGEVSAYSIFNRGVRRLPGQLDADEIDRQMRQGQLG
ncbi:hypothetical protein HYH02_001584 [Chlamydomonas schloesseri]|uniref:SAYSvFN domain-containing protein n=1 Tax=Chlamydomonas schloesseri TaxID=2026947 RepID=A0A835WVR9_9CHLO|nr:hypothetical protein HYH02_001584 [Chlamydomonas schloesseri]|eukprot:KAG2453360.1 hypothetical protein HYH02_001584 [Chlamydomonas schloesseri]